MKLALKAQYKWHGIPYRDETYLACSPRGSDYTNSGGKVKQMVSIFYKDGPFGSYCNSLPDFIKGLFE